MGSTQGVDYKIVTSPDSLYDRYEITLSNLHINILEKGLPTGIKGFVEGEGSPAIKEFTAQVTIFNCVEPMHPIFSTAEVAIVIKNFELHFGIRFVDNLLRIMNSVLQSLDTSDQKKFLESFSKKPSSLQAREGEEISKRVKQAIDAAHES